MTGPAQIADDPGWSCVLPVLVHIQCNLEGNLTLDALSGFAGYSKFHFHRIFQETVGETVKQYTSRLRLELAAFQLRISKDPILQIALANGFQSPENFTRAFQAKYGKTPSSYRNSWIDDPSPPAVERRRCLNQQDTPFALSKSRICTLKPIHLAFIRSTGPYEEVDPGHFRRLEAWSRKKGWAREGAVIAGIGHDAPSITPPEKLRFDACVEVPSRFASEKRIAHQTLPTGTFAVTDYVGPFGQTLSGAYPRIFQRIQKLRGYALIGLPVVEFYRTTRINPNYELNHAAVCIPVRKEAKG